MQARTEALSAVPAGLAALEVYSEAERAADAAKASEQEAAQHACQVAEIEAHTKHGDANVAVMDTLQSDNAAAEEAYRASMEECERASRRRGTRPPAWWARRPTRRARPPRRSRQGAGRLREGAGQGAGRGRREVSEGAVQEQRDDDCRDCRGAGGDGGGAAGRRGRRDKAVRAASAALTKAINADAASRAVETDFQARLQKDDQDAAAEKAAVWERMNRDLRRSARAALVCVAADART